MLTSAAKPSTTITTTVMVTRVMIVILAGMAAGLQVDQVKLWQDRYVTFDRDPMELECRYTLAEGEQLASIRWDVLKDGETKGAFTWMPGQEGKATGLLVGLANVTSDDGRLFVQQPPYALAANYTCTITTTDGAQGTASDEVLVVDLTAYHSRSASDADRIKCVLKLQEGISPIFPPPTYSLALHSKSDSSYIKPLAMHKIYYSNGSVALSFDGEVKIDSDIPQDYYVAISYGLTKADGTYISLIQARHYANFFPSCANMSVDVNQTVTYNTNNLNCFKAHQKPYGDLKAWVRCKEGFINTTNVAEVEMYCHHNYTMWEPSQEGVMPQHLICEEDPPKTVELVEEAGAETTTLNLTMLLPCLLLLLLADI